MPGDSPGANDSTTTPESAGMRLASEFGESVRGQLEALEAAARDFLEREAAAGRSAANELRVEIKVSLHPDAGPPTYRDGGYSCWTISLPCGKTPTGYIMCQKLVCVAT